MKKPVAPAITEKVLFGLEVIARNGLLVEYIEGMVEKWRVEELEDFKYLQDAKVAIKFIKARRKYETEKAAYAAVQKGLSDAD